MNIYEHVSKRLNALGLSTFVDKDTVIAVKDQNEYKIIFETNSDIDYQNYKTYRSISFDQNTRVFVHNNTVEIQLIPLSQNYLLNQENYNFIDDNENTIYVGRCSLNYQLAFFDTSEYDSLFQNRYKESIFRSPSVKKHFRFLLPMFITATYTHKGRKTPSDLLNRAIKTINTCLFKLSVDYDECFIIRKPRTKKTIRRNIEIPQLVHIKNISYEESVVNYFKVALSSPFPSQSFLSFYHVLEYYFLKVSELKLHARLAGLLNSTNFFPSNEKIGKVISIVRGQDSKNDETEMLKSVLDRFIDENELMEFIKETEEQFGEKIYTKKRIIFGEQMQIALIQDHTLSNTSKVLKHIRNAIVHSSDRYSREECHVPLTDSEDMIEEFIPLIRFLSEKVIFGNAF